MHIPALVTAFILGLTLTICSGQPSLSVDISDPIVKEGEDVTIRCRIANPEIGLFIYWWKNQDGQETQMGTNDNLNDVFSGTGRYTADIVDNDDELIFMLNIIGAVPEDSGEIGCQIPTLEDVKAYAKIDVVASLQEIRLFAMRSNQSTEDPINEFMDGDEVQFNEGDEYYFQCRAGGGTYPPAFQMSIGDEDITTLFSTEESYEVGDGQPGLKRLIYNGQATTNHPVVVTKDQNAREFRCNAGVPGWDTEPLSIHIKPVLRFGPVVTCPKKVVHELYESSIKDLKCTVKADPPLTDLKWLWVREVHNGKKVFKYNMSLGIDDNHASYSHKVEDGEYPDEVVSMLYIDRATSEKFLHYTLYAKNELGETRQMVPLILENPGALQAASSITVSTLLITTLAAMAIFLRL